MTRGFGRFLRHNMIAMLALFVALGGTTYAASSALIGKNTVASPQVVNGSLQTRDLSKKARAALKGNRGPRGLQGSAGAIGAQGPKGTTGVQGPQGPSNGLGSGNTSSPTALTTTPTVVRSLALPAGSYVVWGKATGLLSSGTGYVSCQLVDPAGAEVDFATTDLEPPAVPFNTIALTGVMSGGGNATLKCFLAGGSVGAAYYTHLTAIQVGSSTGTALTLKSSPSSPGQ
jgi:hypothetical protein